MPAKKSIGVIGYVICNLLLPPYLKSPVVTPFGLVATGEKSAMVGSR
jgi:hypothetical protein